MNHNVDQVRGERTTLAPVPGMQLREARDIYTIAIRTLLAGDSPRLDGESSQHVQVLAEAEVPLPPILVHRRTMRVIDGMHRLRVAVLKGQETIQAVFFDGTEDEAFVAAVKANMSHGLPLTLADRRAAAQRIIAASPQLSDRSIAVITGLAAGTVAAIRDRTHNGRQTQARIGRDGRIRPLNSADGRQLASDEINRRPDASLREIARAAGISPATVRDVRERLRRGEDPVPRRQDGGRPGIQSRADLAAPESKPCPATPSRDYATLMKDLRRDPSLRLTESGRALLRWLDARAVGPGDWQALFGEIPPHCFYVIVQIARCCADEWLEVAKHLEQRLRGME